MTIRYDLTFPRGEYNYARRESVAFTIDKEPLNDGCLICLSFDPSYGTPYRYLELTAADARQMADYLVKMADAADEIADREFDSKPVPPVRVLHITEG